MMTYDDMTPIAKTIGQWTVGKACNWADGVKEGD